MEKNHPVNELMEQTIARIRETVDANTVVGDPIEAGEVTLIPISKVSFGFGSGGSEVGGRNSRPLGENPFGGGGGAGIKVTPVCFIVVNGANVRILPVSTPAENGVERLLTLLPDTVDKISGLIEKKKGGSAT